MQTCDQIVDTVTACVQEHNGFSDLTALIEIGLGALLVASLPLILGLLIIWIERKAGARIADRIGPNRVGPFGLLQNIADAIKLIGKEAIIPAGVDKPLYHFAPILAMFSVLLIWAVIPLSPVHIGTDLEIGLLYVLAVSSIGTIAIIMAGWASNNKYSLLGAFRIVAQLISYEVPLAMSALVPVLLAGTMRMQGITEAQTGMWFIFLAPVSALIFFISNQAETGRSPFDLLEADSEIVAGYNIEYSGMRFGLFMMSEFIHSFTVNVLFAVVFLGGWSGPFVHDVPILGFFYLMLKAMIPYMLTMLLRFGMVRLRIDQLMRFNWTFMVPLSIINLLVMAFLIKVLQETGISPAPDDAHNFVANLPQMIILFLANMLMIGAILNRLRTEGREARQRLVALSGD